MSLFLFSTLLVLRGSSGVDCLFLVSISPNIKRVSEYYSDNERITTKKYVHKLRQEWLVDAKFASWKLSEELLKLMRTENLMQLLKVLMRQTLLFRKHVVSNTYIFNTYNKVYLYFNS